MHFGPSDTVPTDPVSVTSTSITWKWMESKDVPTGGEQYVRYTLYYRRAGDNEWIPGPDIPYSTDTWQTGTVTGLDPDTDYQFNIAVYRQWTDGTRFESTFWAYKETTTIPLSATTWKGNNTYNAFTLHVYHSTNPLVIYVIICLFIAHTYLHRFTKSIEAMLILCS